MTARPVKPGVVAAVDAVLQAANDDLAPEPQQLSLAPELAPAPRPPGRPAGVPNRRTQDLRDYLEARGVRPALRLAEILGPGLTTREAIAKLADDAGMTRPAAAELFVGVAKALLPYTEPQLASLKLETDAATAAGIGAGAAAGLLHLHALQQLAQLEGSGLEDQANDNAVDGQAEELRDAG